MVVNNMDADVHKQKFVKKIRKLEALRRIRLFFVESLEN